jgi:hypothetical protein
LRSIVEPPSEQENAAGPVEEAEVKEGKNSRLDRPSGERVRVDERGIS